MCFYFDRKSTFNIYVVLKVSIRELFYCSNWKSVFYTKLSIYIIRISSCKFFNLCNSRFMQFSFYEPFLKRSNVRNFTSKSSSPEKCWISRRRNYVFQNKSRIFEFMVTKFVVSRFFYGSIRVNQPNILRYTNLVHRKWFKKPQKFIKDIHYISWDFNL